VGDDREGALVGEDDVVWGGDDLPRRLVSRCEGRNRERSQNHRQKQKCTRHAYPFLEANLLRNA
jgi:hypothetical protein